MLKPGTRLSHMVGLSEPEPAQDENTDLPVREARVGELHERSGSVLEEVDDHVRVLASGHRNLRTTSRFLYGPARKVSE